MSKDKFFYSFSIVLMLAALGMALLSAIFFNEGFLEGSIFVGLASCLLSSLTGAFLGAYLMGTGSGKVGGSS